MNAIGYFVFAVAVAAPPPQPASNPGRINLTVDGEFISFRPDGTDKATFEIPDGINLSRNSFILTHDHKYAIHSDVTGMGIGRTNKLAVTPVVPEGPKFTLDGYVTLTRLISRDGTKVYFTGCKCDVFDAKKDAKALFALDIPTKQVTTLPLPPGHRLVAVSPDGKAFLTTINETAGTLSRRTFLTRAGEKPTEILKSNYAPVNRTLFSPDGSKILMEVAELELMNFQNGQMVIKENHPEYLMLDVGTKITRPFGGFPSEPKPRVSSWDWSPNGNKIAYVTSGGSEYKVYVADADGGNAHEIIKSPYGTPSEGSLGALGWR